MVRIYPETFRYVKEEFDKLKRIELDIRRGRAAKAKAIREEVSLV